MKYFMDYIALISNILTIFASGIAIFLFVAKRDSIISIFHLLMNYAYQLSLSELKEKLERLNDYNASDPDQCMQVINILHEIIGQIHGNDKLKSHFSEPLTTIESIISNRKRLTEPRKRAIVSELRERIRHLNIKNIDDLIGE